MAEDAKRANQQEAGIRGAGTRKFPSDEHSVSQHPTRLMQRLQMFQNVPAKMFFFSRARHIVSKGLHGGVVEFQNLPGVPERSKEIYGQNAPRKFIYIYGQNAINVFTFMARTP